MLSLHAAEYSAILLSLKVSETAHASFKASEFCRLAGSETAQETCQWLNQFD